MDDQDDWLAVAAFYKFVTLEDCAALKDELLELGVAHGIKGTILLAPEGINATISGSPDQLEAFLATLRSHQRFADLNLKISRAPKHPFQRFKVKLKPEIVTFGVPHANPAERVGTYVAAENWNSLIQEPGVVIIDTRNAYEVAIGTFPGARDPGTTSFGAFAQYVQEHLDPARDRKVAMFCTGGIRCEKASSYLLSQGFENVFHLKGGILQYLKAVPPAESLWQGECFVFDERVALEHGVMPGTHALCKVCGFPISQNSRDDGGCPQCRETLHTGERD